MRRSRSLNPTIDSCPINPHQLIISKAAKDPTCAYHAFPSTNDEPAGNCAIDGYMMKKTIDPRTETPLEMLPEGTTSTTTDDTVRFFKQFHFPRQNSRRENRRIETDEKRKRLRSLNINEKCVMTAGVSIEWSTFGDELVHETEFLIENASKSAFVCLRVVSRKPEKKTHMPWKNDPYLYVVLVCSAKGSGMGQWLMDSIEGMARHLSLETIVLSAMPNVLSFYRKFGYTFIEHHMNQVSTQCMAAAKTTPFQNKQTNMVNEMKHALPAHGRTAKSRRTRPVVSQRERPIELRSSRKVKLTWQGWKERQERQGKR